jgi:hypothetical protein
VLHRKACFGLVVSIGLVAGSVMAVAPPAGASPVWKVEASPNPSGSNGTAFGGVACPSTTSCYAVGNYGVGSDVKTLAEHWNGSGWALMTTPSPSTYAFLSSVACPAKKSCYAVGTQQTVSGTKPLIEHWNGTLWGIEGSPSVPSTTTSLNAIACPSNTSCFAVSDYSSGSDVKGLIEHWNGSAWSIMSSPNPTSYVLLAGIACAGTSSCYAAGSSTVAGKTLVEHWDSHSWSVMSTPNPSTSTATALSTITCPSSTSCFAVGTATTSTVHDLVLRWNGHTWTIVGSPQPSGSTSMTPNSITCPSTTSCFIVGFWDHSVSSASKSLIEHWNGSSWSLMTSPNPGAAFTHLWSVKCTGTQSCFAVGGESSTSVSKTLVEQYAS